ncbi:hypothetical protein FKM82_016711 [Ascaphus truei]
MPFGSSTGSLHSSLPSGRSHSYLPFLLRDETGLNSQSLAGLNDPNGVYLEPKDQHEGNCIHYYSSAALCYSCANLIHTHTHLSCTLCYYCPRPIHTSQSLNFHATASSTIPVMTPHTDLSRYLHPDLQPPLLFLHCTVSLSADSDSDSDLSLEDDHSCSFASTHSSDSEDGGGGPGGPCWETLMSPNNEKLLHSALKVDNVASQGRPQVEPSQPNGELRLGDHTVTSPQTSVPPPQKGILKKKKQRSSINRIHNELGPSALLPPSRGSSGSEGERGHRTKPTLQEQLNGVTPIPMSIKTGTAGEESSGSESDETSI